MKCCVYVCVRACEYNYVDIALWLGLVHLAACMLLIQMFKFTLKTPILCWLVYVFVCFIAWNVMLIFIGCTQFKYVYGKQERTGFTATIFSFTKL